MSTTSSTTSNRHADHTHPHHPSHPFKVDIWADVMCPWCYLGKRRLERAAASFAAKGLGEGRKVEVEFHSFQLAPDLPAGKPEAASEYLQRETGQTRAEVDAMVEHINKLGRAVGIEYDFDAAQVTNTMLAHQLIHFVKAEGKQLEAEEALFAAYFTQGRNVGDVNTLADIAEEIGLDREGAIRSLDEKAHLDAVRADMDQARAFGISGVPFFVVDGKYGLSGAQETGVLERALEKAWADRESE